MHSGSSSKPPSSAWKGKQKASDSDYDDLNPIITYRHLHSNNLGVKDPLRVIALCDSDAFYAACEQVRLGLDPSIPLVVQQWDALIAVNYPARKFGISRMDKVKDAKKRCPNLVAVHVATYKEGEKEPGYWDNPDTLTHKVSLDHYRRESAKIIQLFKDSLPGAEIERASIDEAFIDLTRPVRDELKKRYPYLAEVPLDAPEGRDSPLPSPPPISWDGLGTVVPIVPPPPEALDEPVDLRDRSHPCKTGEDEEAGVDEDDEATSWHDVALSIAAELMSATRKTIHAKLGYTTSAGLARNKFIAKIRFLGGKLGKALAQEYDVSIVSDLLTISLEEMQRKFGENSIWVYEILRGIDRSEGGPSNSRPLLKYSVDNFQRWAVKEKPAVTKSMLASKNLPQPIVKTSQGHHWIRVLAAELALRLKEARDNDPALWPKSIVLHARQGYETGRSKQMPFPFTRDITVDVIASYGDKLWKELVGTDDKRSNPMKITNVSLSFSGIDAMEAGQQIIEGFFKPQSTDQGRTSETNVSLKRKREKGEEILESDIEIDEGHRNDESDIRPQISHHPVNSGIPGTSSSKSSFLCDRCGKHIALPAGLGNESDLGDDIINEALAALRLEHDDYHLRKIWRRKSKVPGKLSSLKIDGQSHHPSKERRLRVQAAHAQKSLKRRALHDFSIRADF
ncbi:hypothetical protein NLI96_g3957 [Meripilus lineatus]|uniref:DNA polymerase eta n=1 Tax=Meripilus lineatus TaxID=2056292 RepID=A0AAD5V5U5_9APHY|nr:hypothetical protein NLI96_g3957 [Physisporinus lineatus]